MSQDSGKRPGEAPGVESGSCSCGAQGHFSLSSFAQKGFFLLSWYFHALTVR